MTTRLLSLLLASFLLASCSKSPVSPPAPEASRAPGNYYGYASLGGDPVNILFRVFEADTNGSLSGTIRYNGITTLFASITTDSLEDSLFITYNRSGTAYTARTPIYEVGLSLRYTSHSGIPVVYLNRDVDDYNMTGSWQGQMQSNLLNVTNDATMEMAQASVLFNGLIATSLFETLQADINSGAVNNEFFQISGNATYAGSNYDVLFVGSYVAADSIAGDWYLGENGNVDNGGYEFYRTY